MATSTAQLEALLSQWESDRSLLDQDQFARRVAVEDELDSIFSDGPIDAESTRDLYNRARALQFTLDSINTKLFTTIRRQVQSGICPAEFLPYLRTDTAPVPGLAYDQLDDLIAGVFQFEPPPEEPRALSPESVFYQPTPARHIFHLISAAAITKSDKLIDLGSGLGHVSLLVSICTGATSIGIELDPAWVASAERCATALNLHNVTFRTQDARNADLSTGTVFYLYTPFTGATLTSVLESLRRQADLRPIRICTFGPCTLTLAQQPWLRASSPPATDQITVFTPHS